MNTITTALPDALASPLAAAAQHRRERAPRALPPMLRQIVLALAAATIVFATALGVRAALTMLVPASAMQPMLPAVAIGRAALAADPAAAVIRATADNAPEIASPAAGTTGTAELPPIPLTAELPMANGTTVTPARPFSLAGATATDRGRALECLTAAIYYEAASEPDDGQRAVAQVVLNRARHPVFPASVCGVVYQGSERSGCQFSFACDGSIARIPSRSGWARATRVAAAALGGYVFAPIGLATHYHTYAVTPAWNRTLVMTDAIGAHFFHRWKGFWGTAAAFTQRYTGREPFPGPHPRSNYAPGLPGIVPASPMGSITIGSATPVTAAQRAVTPPQNIQPQHSVSGDVITRSRNADDPDSQVLDQWKDSGKPLY